MNRRLPTFIWRLRNTNWEGDERLFDILVKDGFIIDGSGNPWFRADVAIEDGKIAKIGRISASFQCCAVVLDIDSI